MKKFKAGDIVIAKLDDPTRFDVRNIKPVKVIKTIPYDSETNTLFFNEDPGFGHFRSPQDRYNSDYFVLAKPIHTKLGKILYK